MFAGKRKELQETVTNWKKSPELARSSSTRSLSSKEYPNDITPPTNNKLFRSQSTRSPRRLPFFRNNKHGIFNVNNDNNNSFKEEKPMKPIYINPNSDSIVDKNRATINYSSHALSPLLSPASKEKSQKFFSPPVNYRPDPDYPEQELDERRGRRRSRSFSGYTNKVNPSLYPPVPPVPPVPNEPPPQPKVPVTPKRSKSLTRGRTPTRQQNVNSTLNSARKAVQNVKNRQQNGQPNLKNSPSINELSRKASQSSKLEEKSSTLDRLQPPVNGQTSLKRTQSLKASLQRWGVEHKKSQSQLSNPSTSPSPVPPVPIVPPKSSSPTMSSEENSPPKKLDNSMTNRNHSDDSVLNNPPRIGSLSSKSVNQNSLSPQNNFNGKNTRKINGKLSNELLVSSLSDTTSALSEPKENLTGLSRSASLKNSSTENSTLIRKHSYRMSIYSDLDDPSMDSLDNSTFIKSFIKEKNTKNTILEEEEEEEEEPLRKESLMLSNEEEEEPLRKESLLSNENLTNEFKKDEDSNGDHNKSFKILGKKHSISNLYRDRRRASPPQNEFKEPMKLMEPVKPMEPMKQMEPEKPMEPMKPVEPVKPMESVKPLEPMKLMEPIKPMESATESIKPLEKKEAFSFKEEQERHKEDRTINNNRHSEDHRYPEDKHYTEDNRYTEDSRYSEGNRNTEDSRYKDDNGYPEDNRYPKERRYKESVRFQEDNRYPEDKCDPEEDHKQEDKQEDKNSQKEDSKHDDKDDNNNQRTSLSSYPDDDGVEEVIYATIRTMRSSTSTISNELPDIAVLSNSDVGYDDIPTTTTTSLSNVNQSSFITNQATKRIYNAKPKLTTTLEVSNEESKHEIEGERSPYTDIGTDASSPICNPNNILMGEKFNENNYIPNVPPFKGEQGLKMKRSNSFSKSRKNILMRPRELFPRSASLRSKQPRDEIPQQHDEDPNNSVEKEKKSVNKSLDNLLAQLEKIKNEETNENSGKDRMEEKKYTISEENHDGSIPFKRINKQKLIISNLERKTPEPVVWNGSNTETNRRNLQIERNIADTVSIHIEAEEVSATEYTESKDASDLELNSNSISVSRRESPDKEMMTQKSSIGIQRIGGRNDSEEKSFKSSISNGRQRSPSNRSGSPPSKPKSIIQEREKKNNVKGGLSPSLLSSSAWQYFNSKKEDHRVIHPSQTPTSLGNSPIIYRSPNLHNRKRSFNSKKIVPPMMPSNDVGKSTSNNNNNNDNNNDNNEHSSFRKMDTIDNNEFLKPRSVIPGRSHSVKIPREQNELSKLGILARSSSLKGKPKFLRSKPLYIISPAVPTPKQESSPNSIVKDGKIEEKMIPSPTTGKLRRRVPPEKDNKSKNIKINTDVMNSPSDKTSEISSGHSLLPSVTFNETPLSIEICNALVQDTVNKNGKDDATMDLYNALSNRNSQVVSPYPHRVRSHRRSMPHPRSVINNNTRKTGPSREEDIIEEKNSEINSSNASERQSIVLVSPNGLQKFNVVKQTNRSTVRENESHHKENNLDHTVGMENSLRLEKSRLEVTVGKDQELNDLAEKLLMEGGDNKVNNYSNINNSISNIGNMSYLNQTSYIITPEKKKKKGEFLKNSMKIFKRKSNENKNLLISSPELISFSNNNGNMETYPLNTKTMKLGNIGSPELDEKSTVQYPSLGHNRNKSLHLTPIVRKTSVNNNSYLHTSSINHSATYTPSSPLSPVHSPSFSPAFSPSLTPAYTPSSLDRSYDNKNKKKSHKIGRMFSKKK